MFRLKELKCIEPILNYEILPKERQTRTRVIFVINVSVVEKKKHDR